MSALESRPRVMPNKRNCSIFDCLFDLSIHLLALALALALALGPIHPDDGGLRFLYCSAPTYPLILLVYLSSSRLIFPPHLVVVVM